MKATVYLMHALLMICIFLSIYKNEKYKQSYRSSQRRIMYLARNREETKSHSSFNEEKWIQPVFSKIKQSADFLFGFTLHIPVKIILVTPVELRKLVNATNTQDLILFGYIEYRVDGPIIYLRRGLSKEEFFVTLAHEYAHVWQKQEGFWGGSPERVEGFAEWFAYKLAEMEGYNVCELFFPSSGHPTSIGLRKFLTIESLYGFHGTVKAGKSSRLDLSILR